MEQSMRWLFPLLMVLQAMFCCIDACSNDGLLLASYHFVLHPYRRHRPAFRSKVASIEGGLLSMSWALLNYYCYYSEMCLHRSWVQLLLDVSVILTAATGHSPQIPRAADDTEHPLLMLSMPLKIPMPMMSRPPKLNALRRRQWHDAARHARHRGSRFWCSCCLLVGWVWQLPV